MNIKEELLKFDNLGQKLPQLSRPNSKYEPLPSNIKKETQFLLSSAKMAERVYCILNNIKERTKCIECNKNEVEFSRVSYGYKKFCSQACNKLWRDKNQKKGVIKDKETWRKNLSEAKKKENRSQESLDKEKELRIKNCREKYGTDWYSQSQEIKDKVKQVNIERYGISNGKSKKVLEKQYKNFRKQGKNINGFTKETKKKFKETYSNKSKEEMEEILSKREKTCLKIYGTKNASQSPEIVNKIFNSTLSIKPIILPSGKEVKVQGFEGPFIAKLLESYKEDEIYIHKNVPSIKYKYLDKYRIHFPDLFIPKENRIIEIKSMWTFKVNKPKCLAKKEGALILGYLYDGLIVDETGKIIERY